MNTEGDTKSLKTEIESILRQYGVSGESDPNSKLTPEQFRRIRDIGNRAVHGNVDREEIAKLGEDLSANLDDMVRYLLALRNKPSLRELEEKNPYYTAYGSKIVRDKRK